MKKLIFIGLLLLSSKCFGGVNPIGPKYNIRFSSDTPLNVKDFGAKGDGISIDSTAIQAAYNYAAANHLGTILLPGGTFYIGTSPVGLTFDKEFIRVIGSGNTGDETLPDYSSTKLVYAGTGTAVKIGFSDMTFIRGVSIENLAIRVATFTNIGLQLDEINNCYFKQVSVQGNVGVGNYGIKINGGIASLFDQVRVMGTAIGHGSISDRLGWGLFIGYGSSIPSQMDFRRSYFHYCAVGAQFGNGIGLSLDHCDLEANTTGFWQTANATVQINDTKWEANMLDIWFEGDVNASPPILNINNSNFNDWASRGRYIDGLSNQPYNINLINCQFGTTYNNQTIFSDSALYGGATHNISIINPIYSGSGTGATNPNMAPSGSRGISIIKNVGLTGGNGYATFTGVQNNFTNYQIFEAPNTSGSELIYLRKTGIVTHKIKTGQPTNSSDLVLSNDSLGSYYNFTSTNSQFGILGATKTGSGTALLGTNSPAGTVSAPYTWITLKVCDPVDANCSTVYVPVWK